MVLKAVQKVPKEVPLEPRVVRKTNLDKGNLEEDLELAMGSNLWGTYRGRDLEQHSTHPVSDTHLTLPTTP